MWLTSTVTHFLTDVSQSTSPDVPELMSIVNLAISLLFFLELILNFVQDENTITCCSSGKINPQLSLCKICIKIRSFCIFYNVHLQLDN